MYELLRNNKLFNALSFGWLQSTFVAKVFLFLALATSWISKVRESSDLMFEKLLPGIVLILLFISRTYPCISKKKMIFVTLNLVTFYSASYSNRVH